MTDHEEFMQRALKLAETQAGRTGKNPNVGCILVDAQGQVLSEAVTGDGGRPHAEQIALAAAPLGSTRGATAYVTLEPCQQRSTGEAACSTALIEAGVTKVVIAVRDPHPQGHGGIERLEAAGVIVECGVLQEAAERLYADFFQSVTE